MVVQRIKKQQLRRLAQRALEERGHAVTVEAGRGLVAGARLRAVSGDGERRVAVRVSLDREIGFSRHPDGRWMTMPNVDDVLVVVPSTDNVEMADIFLFESEILEECFRQALEARTGDGKDIPTKSTIFVALDEVERGRSSRGPSNVKERAAWSCIMPLAAHKDVQASENSLFHCQKAKILWM